MHQALLEILRCPQTGSRLKLSVDEICDGRVRSGWLTAETSGQRYPIRDCIPRFVPTTNYADNFGMQWNRFRYTQLDSHSGIPVSAERFWKATGWLPGDLEGNWVLDAGCGAGRFAEVALSAGANVVALDYSSAVDACYANLSPHPNLHVVQGDIYALPLIRSFFPFVYSLGVLQHTPDVARATLALPPMLSAAGGRLAIDFYEKTWRMVLHPKYWLRPITKRMSQERLFERLQRRVPGMFDLSCRVQRVPIAGRFLKRLIPVANYSGTYPLSRDQLLEWALLDTFDWLSPAYDQPQTQETVRRWLEQAGLVDIEVSRAGHLIGRGRRVADAVEAGGTA